MNHLSPRYRRRRTPQQQREFRAAQQRRIERRWKAALAGATAGADRRDRVSEVTIRDTHRPMVVVRLEARMTRGGRRWGRRAVYENGRRVGARRLGLRAIGELLAGVLS
jgi:hypothetical protein